MAMKFYQMSDKVLLKNFDGREPVGLYKRSHRFTETKTGRVLVDYSSNDNGEPFKGPLVCELDDEDATGIFPTIFMSPALIGTKQFYKDLVEFGIDNIEMHSVTIKDEGNKRTIDDYVLLNIIGRVSCAVMESDCKFLNDEVAEDNSHGSMNFTGELVIDTSKTGDFDLFLVHEDTNCILVSERVYKYLRQKGYNDIFFEEVKQV